MRILRYINMLNRCGTLHGSFKIQNGHFRDGLAVDSKAAPSRCTVIGIISRLCCGDSDVPDAYDFDISVAVHGRDTVIAGTPSHPAAAIAACCVQVKSPVINVYCPCGLTGNCKVNLILLLCTLKLRSGILLVTRQDGQVAHQFSIRTRGRRVVRLFPDAAVKTEVSCPCVVLGHLVGGQTSISNTAAADPIVAVFYCYRDLPLPTANYTVLSCAVQDSRVVAVLNRHTALCSIISRNISN